MITHKLITLAILIVFTTTTSCTKDEPLENITTEGIKPLEESPDNSSTVNNFNTLSKNEILLLLDRDEKDLSIEILKHINNYRNSHGLKSLINNRTAKCQALSHSKHQGNNYQMSHTGSSSRAAVIFKLENASFYGENVAFGYSSTKKLVQAWINSESHRKNIEGDFTYSGIGTIANDKGVLYFTQIFFK